MKGRKKEVQGMQHPRKTNVFEERNTEQKQDLIELKPKDLEIYYAWSLYSGSVPIHVKKHHTSLKDLDDGICEKDAVVSQSNLVPWVIDYHERRQAL